MQIDFELEFLLLRCNHSSLWQLQLGDVRIDGPYGSAGDLTATADLVLVAGGIGITPIISVYGELLALAKVLDSQLTSTALRRVRLIWSSRELSELALFAATLHEAAQHTDESMTTADTGTVRFESHLFLTSGSGKESEVRPKFRHGLTCIDLTMHSFTLYFTLFQPLRLSIHRFSSAIVS